MSDQERRGWAGRVQGRLRAKGSGWLSGGSLGEHESQAGCGRRGGREAGLGEEVSVRAALRGALNVGDRSQEASRVWGEQGAWMGAGRECRG